MRGLGYNTEYKTEYKTGRGRRLRRSNVEDGLGSLEQDLGRDGNVGAVVKRRAGKGFTRRIEHGAEESTSTGKSGVGKLGQA